MDVRDKIALFPHSPGVYRYYDSEGTVIYVGKAKDLHKRVAQYFVAPERLNAKTRVLVSKIADAQYSVVDSEADALLLENNLIKQYKPRYNILLKDSKTYPWICVTNEPFPRVFLTRRVVKNGSLYFGPYSSARHAYALLEFFEPAYPLRSCKLKLDIEGVLRRKYRPCLDLHLGKCKGPCVGKYSQAEYAADIAEIVRILKGDTAGLIREYTARMQQAAADLDFETAQVCKERLDILSEHYSKSVIVAACGADLDVFCLDFDTYVVGDKGVVPESGASGAISLAAESMSSPDKASRAISLAAESMSSPDKASGAIPPTAEYNSSAKPTPSAAWGNFMRIRGGAVVQSLNLALKSQIEESREAMLSAFIAEIEAQFGELSKEVIVPFMPDVEIEGVEFKIPSRGDKLALLELSAKNAREFHFNSLRQLEKTDPEQFKKQALEEIREALGMKELPMHIECFDNSNIQGTNPVASCVVFRGGMPSKKDYRKFKIKTVVGANDYASMKEVVNRRYSRMLAETPDDLPQLVVIDGGKGQLGFAWQAVQELGLEDKFMVVGLAKRLEEIVRVDDPYPLFLDRNSQAFRVITHIRDEAHRFGITFHRSLRSKSQIHSALDEIPGVGERTRERLLLRFGSVARIAAASESELAALVGPKLASAIHEALTNDMGDKGVVRESGASRAISLAAKTK
ncbi:MAG: excinuclease ABC subunit UvrC [Bacteroidales bacterium]|nr:excinuclease ABC subunit UvrC [Bacteroidales bacterium]